MRYFARLGKFVNFKALTSSFISIPSRFFSRPGGLRRLPPAIPLPMFRKGHRMPENMIDPVVFFTATNELVQGELFAKIPDTTTATGALFHLAVEQGCSEITPARFRQHFWQINGRQLLCAKRHLSKVLAPFSTLKGLLRSRSKPVAVHSELDLEIMIAEGSPSDTRPAPGRGCAIGPFRRPSGQLR